MKKPFDYPPILIASFVFMVLRKKENPTDIFAHNNLCLQIEDGSFWEPEEFTVMWREER